MLYFNFQNCHTEFHSWIVNILAVHASSLCACTHMLNVSQLALILFVWLLLSKVSILQKICSQTGEIMAVHPSIVCACTCTQQIVLIPCSVDILKIFYERTNGPTFGTLEAPCQSLKTGQKQFHEMKLSKNCIYCVYDKILLDKYKVPDKIIALMLGYI